MLIPQRSADIVRETMLHHLSRAVNRPNLNAEAEQQRGESSNKVLQTLRLGLILVLVVAPSSVLWLSAGASQPLTRVPPLWWGAWGHNCAVGYLCQRTASIDESRKGYSRPDMGAFGNNEPCRSNSLSLSVVNAFSTRTHLVVG